MFCCQIEEPSSNYQPIQYQDSPLKIKLIQSLGLDSYLINKFVFQKKQSAYSFKHIEGKYELFFDEDIFDSPHNYQHICSIITTNQHSIPILFMKLKNKIAKSTIIYSHGNGSDLKQAAKFISALAELHQANYVVYDYSGYGQSKIKDTSEKTICEDLQMVISWVNIPLDQIVLIGFSLGCFPTVEIASKHRVRGVILLSPMASMISLFESNLKPSTFFKNDSFNLLQHIQNIESHILIMHSRHDELIPFEHSQIIYQRYRQLNPNPSIELIQIQNVKHNEIHKHIISYKPNPLQTQFLNFLKKIPDRSTVDVYLYRHKKQDINRNGKLTSDMMQLLRNQQKYRKKQSLIFSSIIFDKLKKKIQSQ